MEDDDDQKELQLLPAPHSTASSSNVPSALSGSSSRRRSAASDPYELAPSLDLQLSISLRPIRPPTNGCAVSGGPAREYGGHAKPETNNVRALKWEAAEQIRLAAIEKAYAERVRELTRREMELAQSEFARARHMWERAREEVDRAERMKERATRQIDSACMEITCQSCRQRFRPA
ncbi:protein indeterminate-domain 16 [Eucalyptus grandis]|uniref:Protein SHOOT GRAVITROPISM 5 n=1 Tax=Eucalyptus globulus TaxID=34317 RepID=A0ABD3IQT4_EUCGL|nr:protein indeterminate-domain 16 [Eucalyptus grandis]